MHSKTETQVADGTWQSVDSEQNSSEFRSLICRPILSGTPTLPAVATPRLSGFDLDDRPLVSELPGLTAEIVAAEATISLSREHIGARVVVLFDQGDVRRPIVIGVLDRKTAHANNTAESCISVQVDNQRVVLTAEREIVLRCGDASITLTSAGRVVVKGKYILSHSSGYNKIKGAAVDIN